VQFANAEKLWRAMHPLSLESYSGQGQMLKDKSIIFNTKVRRKSIGSKTF
jgi:hypothetical protein